VQDTVVGRIAHQDTAQEGFPVVAYIDALIEAFGLIFKNDGMPLIGRHIGLPKAGDIHAY